MHLDQRRDDFAVIMSNLSSGRVRVHAYGDDGSEIGDVTSHVVELVRINRGWREPSEEEASRFLTGGRVDAVVEGRRIEARLGMAGLRAAHAAVRDILPRGAGRELEAAWHGIGDWRL